MKIDCHTHPLAHRYYYDRHTPQALTDQDKKDITAVLSMGIDRGLDAIAVTDHDLSLAGFWARQYAEKTDLPIRVIAGCECELYFLGEWIHILALNLCKPLSYTPYTTPQDLAAQARSQGAFTVLAHPMCYSESIYHQLKSVVDGIEVRNGAQESAGRPSYESVLNRDEYAGLRLYNSDYHYPCQPARQQWLAGTEFTESEFAKWFCQREVLKEADYE